jgi:hypothetical protein
MRQDLVPQGWMKRCWLREVHAGVEDFLEVRLHPKKMEESNGPVEFDQQINIAVLAGFIAGNRAVYRKTSNPELLEIFPVLVNAL